MTSLSRRFSAAFLLLVALPSLVVSVILSRLYLSALYRTVELQSQATAEQVAHNVRAETENAAVLAAALFHDAELRRLADGYAQAVGSTERFVWARSLDEKLVSFFTYSNRVGEIVLYLPQGLYRFANDPALRAASAVERAAFAPAMADPGKVFLLDALDAAGGGHMISIAVCPAADDPIAIEAILLRMRVPAFDALAAGPGGDGAGGDGAGEDGAAGEAADDGDRDRGPDVVMLGRGGRPILSSLPSPIDLDAAFAPPPNGTGGDRSLFRDLRVAGRAWLATVRTMESTGWTLLLLVDEAALRRRVTRYEWYIYPAIALLAALFVAYFNRMAGEAGRLQAERERTERERMAAELEALRSQINPHFIANTLNSIKLMASAARADAIAEMTRDLMRMLADSYAGAGALTELSRELAAITAYVGIMKVRFRERFVLEIDAGPGTESLLVLRMILQPIIENAILHGFAGGAIERTTRGTIRVTARREARALPPPPSPEPWARPLPGEVLVIEVRDDGAGMAPGALDAGAAERRRGGPESLHRVRIGIANVQRRITLNFGAPYELAIESEPGAFTLVRFTLPALVRADEAPGARDVRDLRDARDASDVRDAPDARAGEVRHA